jgi:DNA-binding CsgD family transcriptional regulator/PAS domain-containing protein
LAIATSTVVATGMPETPMNLQQLSDTIGVIYDCALEPDLWPQALKQVGELCEAPFAFVLAHDVERNQPGRVFQHGGRAEWMMKYCGQYATINPLHTASWLRPIGEVYTPDNLFSGDEWLQSRFYKEFMQPSGFVDLIGLMGLRSGNRAVWFSAARMGQAPSFSGADSQAFQLLSPHVCRTFKISHALDLRTLKSETLETALDALSAGVFLLDGHARVVHANRAGEQQVRTGSALRLVNNRLSPIDGPANADFIKALSLSADLDGRVANMHSIALPAIDGEGLIATVLPVGKGRRSSLMAPWSAQWAVFSQNPMSVPRIPGEAFARLYGLTGGELRVVLAMAPGLGMPEAAELLGLSKGTVKTHLQRAFQKTGAKKQAELTRLLMASTPPTHG